MPRTCVVPLGTRGHDLEIAAAGAQVPTLALIVLDWPIRRVNLEVGGHPYLSMPSREAGAGPGGFSYYDHVCLPESEKDLTWAHEGRSYRSQVVVRLNGRRKTEAFLFVLAEHGTWVPVVLADGTVSDGKVDTYARCVEALCGPADTFFTSVFSAQGKRQLSTYRNAEIKTLLADLLGQEEIRDRLRQRIAHRTSQERSRWSALQDRRCKCVDALKQAQAVRRAERRLPLAEIVLAARVARVTTWRRQVQCLTECQGAIRTAEQKLSATLREAGQAAIRADDLARRFGLTNAVPCAGTDLQGQCQLLGDAREASTLIPSAKAAMARLAREKASIDAELATLRSQREALSGAPMTLSRSEVECERARARVARLAQWSAKSAEIAQARAALTEIDQELAVAASPGATDGQPVETTEEQAERHQIGATRQQIGNQIEQQSHQLRATLDRLHAALGAMPAAFDVQRLTEAKSAMDQAARGMAAAERTHLDAVRDAEVLAALTVQAAALATRQARAASRIALEPVCALHEQRRPDRAGHRRRRPHAVGPGQ
jgi:hypothetical protein